MRSARCQRYRACMSTEAATDRLVAQSCPAPVRRAVMVQGWYELGSLHWRYPVEDVARLLPAGLEVDTFDGSAWVGLIPFAMRGIGPPRLPAVPYLGSFPEINVRTYVVKDGVPAVWFMSLDINRLIPTLVARATYRLPYCWGWATHRRDGNVLSVDVKRRWPTHGPRTHIKLEIGPNRRPNRSRRVPVCALGPVLAWQPRRRALRPG
jgi:uncharacterized protein